MSTRSQIPVYTGCDSICIKFRNRYNWFTVLLVNIPVNCGKRQEGVGVWMWVLLGQCVPFVHVSGPASALRTRQYKFSARENHTQKCHLGFGIMCSVTVCPAEVVNYKIFFYLKYSWHIILPWFQVDSTVMPCVYLPTARGDHHGESGTACRHAELLQCHRRCSRSCTLHPHDLVPL